MKTAKKKIFAISIFVLLVAALALVWLVFREKPIEGSKEISIEVVGQLSQSVVYEVKTDAQYLRQAMEETEGLEFSGEESEYGLTVYTINGETANYNTDSAYWAFMVNDAYCNYGIDFQPIEDGDVFRIIYTEQ